MSYANEHEDESTRLEWQAKQKHYNIYEEFHQLKLKKSSKVLDAGCGSGLLSRYLLEIEKNLQIDACDFSELRIQQAKNLSKGAKFSKINFIHADLEKLQIRDDTYDLIVSRYVYEHLKDPKVVTSELYRVLKKDGEINIVDFDGVFVNLYSTNERFNQLFTIIKNNFLSDLNIGRKLPAILKQSGFRKITWSVSAEQFSGEDLQMEYKNNKERLRLAKKTLTHLLGNYNLAEEFSKLYLEEMLKEENTLFYNKFIVSAIK